MNRSVALFVALALLIAHALAIHTTPSGDLAPPFDTAFAAFRVGRTLAHEGHFAWSPDGGSIDSYPSLLWVLFSYLIERSFLSINQCAQLASVACALATIFIASRFHSDRVASLIAPFLLAISGSFATIALNGTETALLTLLVTASFVAYERGWSRFFGVFLTLAGLTRPEAWLLVPVYLLVKYTPGLRGERNETPHVSSFLLPIAAFFALGFLRVRLGGELLSPFTHNLFSAKLPTINEWTAGLRDFLVSSVTPALLIYTLWYLLRSRLSHTGRRALTIGGCWVAFTAATQAAVLPFNATMVPVLPALLIAIQEGVINALNSNRSWVRQFAWTSFLLVGLLTILVSRTPSDLGRLELSKIQHTYLEPTQTTPMGVYGWLGRPGLEQEIEKTQFLRATGLFLRDNLDPSSTILTPWPGSIGYLTRMDVRDLFNRATLPPTEERLRSWSQTERTDLLEALEQANNYVIPTCIKTPIAPSPLSLASEWVQTIDDSESHETERLSLVSQALKSYELITVPLPSPAQPLGKRSHGKAYLLRHRDLELTPTLELELQGEFVSVYASNSGHIQLANLRVTIEDKDGNSGTLSPTGRLSNHPVLARMELFLTPTGERKMELFRFEVPHEKWSGMKLSATLLNPGSKGEHSFTQASKTVTLKLP
jgi:hypothetical protein